MTKSTTLSLVTHNPMVANKSLAIRSEFQNNINVALSDATTKFEKRADNLLKIPPPPAEFGLTVTTGALEERLFDAVASAKMLTSQVAMHLKKEWRSKLFHQIDSLHDIEEWEFEDAPLQQSSFATFLKGIIHINPKRPPGLGLSHDGHVIAAWTVDHDRLTIEFLPNERVEWVLSRHIDGDIEAAAGKTYVSRLLQCLMPYQSEKWFSDEQGK